MEGHVLSQFLAGEMSIACHQVRMSSQDRGGAGIEVEQG